MSRRLLKLIPALLLMAAALPAGAATLVVDGPAGASVTINGEPVGFFPLDGPLVLSPGTYELSSDMPGYIPFSTTVVLQWDKDWQQVTVRLIPLSRRTAWSSNILFAGLGQHYMGAGTRGWIYNVAEAGGLLVALGAEIQRSNLRQDYLKLKDNYDEAINADDIARYKAEADQAYSDMKDKEDLRNTGLLVAGGAIVVSIVDALLFFPAIEAGPGAGPVRTGANDDPFRNDGNALTTVHAQVTWKF
jgi:hypothetical protein